MTPCVFIFLGFFFSFLDTLLLSKYFDIRSLMYFAIISKQFRNFLLPWHVIKAWDLCSRSGWLWTWLRLVRCFSSLARWFIAESITLPTSVDFFFNIVSQSCGWRGWESRTEDKRKRDDGSGVSREVVCWKALLLIFKRQARVETTYGKSPVI